MSEINLTKPPPLKVSDEIDGIGLLTWLTMLSPQHRGMTTGNFLDDLREIATDSNKLQVFKIEGDPVAWIAWEWLSHTQLAERATVAQTAGHTIEGDLPPDTGEPHLWWRYWVRPYGCHPRLTEHIAASGRVWWPKTQTTNWFDPFSSDGRSKLRLGVSLTHLHTADQ